MLYYFKKDKNASEMQKKKISVVYEEGTVISVIYHAEDSQHTKNIQIKS